MSLIEGVRPCPMRYPLRTIVPVLLVACMLTGGGCFTAMRKAGEAWGGGSTREAATRAAVADVVTSPVQAPLIAAAFSEESLLVKRAIQARQRGVPRE